jgi:hypothetical protein
LYTVILVEMLGIFVPLMVGLRALRRAQRSKGFNRWIYLYIAVFAFGMLASVALTLPGRGAPYGLSVAGAWATLPVWVWVCHQLRSTPSRFRRHISSTSV